MGYNLYSYCKNSPVGSADYNGHFAITLTIAAATVTLTVVDIVVIVGEAAIIATAVDYCMDPTDIRNPIRKAEVLIENQIAEVKEAKKNKKGKAGTNSKPSNVPYGNGQTANEQAQKHGYANAHDLKDDFVGEKNRSKFDMKYDNNTKQIYLESKDGKIQIPTGLYHKP